MGSRSHRPFFEGEGWGSSTPDLQILDLQVGISGIEEVGNVKVPGGRNRLPRPK